MAPEASESEPIITSCVLLRHTLADGSRHFDWLIERPGDPSEHRLIAFRTDRRPDQTDAAGFSAERLADHRAHYLSYEGPISGGRGSVARVWSSPCVVRADSPGELCVVLQFPHGARGFLGRPRSGSIWHFDPWPA